MTVAEVILTCPWEADSMSISDVLTSQRRWGQTRCRNFLPGADVRDEDDGLDDPAPAPCAQRRWRGNADGTSARGASPYAAGA